MGAFLSGLGKKIGEHYEKKIKQRMSGEGKNSGAPPDHKPPPPPNMGLPDFHKGGMVKKTGLARVHKGERVLTKRQQKRHTAKSRSK